MSCDGAPVERLLDLPDRPLLSVFVPDRLELLKGPPALRRAHLDQVVAALWPVRAETRREYSRVLAQRNALLVRIRAGRRPRERSRPGTASSPPRRWRCRPTAPRPSSCSPSPSPRAPHSSASREASRSSTGRARGRRRAGVRRRAAARLDSDLERGFSGHGPHRDELALLRDGRELRVYGSQGEQRLALLALLLAERAVLGAERGRCR